MRAYTHNPGAPVLRCSDGTVFSHLRDAQMLTGLDRRRLAQACASGEVYAGSVWMLLRDGAHAPRSMSGGDGPAINPKEA